MRGDEVICSYLAPRNPHPDSMLWRCKYGGCENIPETRVNGLTEQEKYDELGDALWAASNSR